MFRKILFLVSNIYKIHRKSYFRCLIYQEENIWGVSPTTCQAACPSFNLLWDYESAFAPSVSFNFEKFELVFKPLARMFRYLSAASFLELVTGEPSYGMPLCLHLEWTDSLWYYRRGCRWYAGCHTMMSFTCHDYLSIPPYHITGSYYKH